MGRDDEDWFGMEIERERGPDRGWWERVASGELMSVRARLAHYLRGAIPDAGQ
jgi:hypothetical protein